MASVAEQKEEKNNKTVAEEWYDCCHPAHSPIIPVIHAIIP